VAIPTRPEGIADNGALPGDGSAKQVSVRRRASLTEVRSHPAKGRRRLGPVPSETLGATVLEALRASILSGHLSSGERLVEVALARELGISRGPLREAMALLEKDGLIVNIPRRGRYVVEFTTKAVDEHYGLRKVLETYAVELVIAKTNPGKIRALERAVRLVREAAEAGDPLRMALADLAFHDTLYQLTDDALLARVWRESVAGKLRMLINITTRTLYPLEVEVENHRIIVDAIREGDLIRARQYVSRHVDDAWRRVRKAVGAAQSASSGPGSETKSAARTAGRRLR